MRWQRVPGGAVDLGSGQRSVRLLAGAARFGHLGRADGARAVANALAVAQLLSRRGTVERVYYPGLPSHPDHDTGAAAVRRSFGSIVTFTLRGGAGRRRHFMAAARRIPFCPSLGELSTTFSHPESTSHRGLTARGPSRAGHHRRHDSPVGGHRIERMRCSRPWPRGLAGLEIAVADPYHRPVRYNPRPIGGGML